MDVLEESQLEAELMLQSYNIIFRMAARKEDLLAEDLLIKMTNGGLEPNEGTMDAFLLNLRPDVALSMAQSCFNQYGSRPLHSNFLIVVRYFAEVRLHMLRGGLDHFIS